MSQNYFFQTSIAIVTTKLNCFNDCYLTLIMFSILITCFQYVELFCYLMANPLYTYILNIYDFEHILFYLPTPPLGQDMTQGQFLSGV